MIDENVAAIGEDLGAKLEGYDPIKVGEDFIDFLHSNNIEAVFAGHVHYNSFCIEYKNIKWAFGVKTGKYDYYYPSRIGGSLITLKGKDFLVSHIFASF